MIRPDRLMRLRRAIAALGILILSTASAAADMLGTYVGIDIADGMTLVLHPHPTDPALATGRLIATDKRRFGQRVPPIV